jgi:diaminopimelate epimerase
MVMEGEGEQAVLKFTKMQGAGNDFVLVESGKDAVDWREFSKAVCDRHYGVGADGLLVLMPSDIADIKMRIFNADGSEPDICGNGLRCMVRYYLDTGRAGGSPETVRVETKAGIREAAFIRENGDITGIRIGMGKPALEEADIPVRPGSSILDINGLRSCGIAAGGMALQFILVSMGNPHAVCFIDRPVTGFPLSVIGPETALSDVFPSGANIEVVRVMDREHLEARVWERGVGETLACGSGACAVAVAARLKGYTGDNMEINLPGGVLGVGWDGKGEVYLSGPAETVFTGEFS